MKAADSSVTGYMPQIARAPEVPEYLIFEIYPHVQYNERMESSLCNDQAQSHHGSQLENIPDMSNGACLAPIPYQYPSE